MPKTQQAPATDQATGDRMSSLECALTKPYHLALTPTDGTDWWQYLLTINDTPAIKFRHGDRAILALDYAVDDMEQGIDITTREHLEDIARGALNPTQRPAVEYQMCGGWS